MPAQTATTDRFQLPASVLSELPDAVIVTDNDGHVVYWNGPAEHLYSLRAEEVLGHPLELCVPELNSERELFLHVRRGIRIQRELVLSREPGKEIYLESFVSPLNDKQGLPAGTLWIQRDVSDRKRLETELRSCQALLRERGRKETAETCSIDSEHRDVVLWAEDDDNDALLMTRAWQQAQVEDQLLRVRDGAEIIQYLSGTAPYEDRQKYPLPRLLLLDIRMPQMTGMQVLQWLHSQPEFNNLPVVMLTSSAATCDVHEAARFGVKGYLVKPVTVADWVVKVKTVTSQCR
jgi:PAS domain S-box-containing protein